jgi:hypothetical protein
LKALFYFAENSALGNWMRESKYTFPAFEMIHLLGLAVLLGSIVLLNVRFFGLGLNRLRLYEVAEDLAPWTRLSLVVMVFSGVPLFCAKAGELWGGDDFRAFTIKMCLIAFGVLFHYFVQVPLAKRERIIKGRAAAAISLCTWFGAAIAGLSLEFI